MSGALSPADERYLSLLERSLIGELEPTGLEVVDVVPTGRVDRFLARAARVRGWQPVKRVPRQPQHLEEGLWGFMPSSATTMVGRKRLRAVRRCIEQVVADEVPGDLIEAGVWRGGCAIWMKAVLEVLGDADRRLVLADSFAGLPAPDADRYPLDADSTLHTIDALAVSPERVRAALERHDLLDDRIELLQGWFRDTLPHLGDRTWSVIRLDGDLYESTMDGLANLEPQLSPGGFMVIDDHGAYEACRQAVSDYRASAGIDAELVPTDWSGVVWRKGPA